MKRRSFSTTEAWVPDAERGSSTFSEAFLDDYFAECDEHLRAIRGALLKLEAALKERRLDTTALEQIFRGCHSLKGLSGMVELREAETLAHELESYLRWLREGKLGLTAAGVDALAEGVNTLERVIAARREQKAMPPIDGPVARIRRLADGRRRRPAERRRSCREAGTAVARADTCRPPRFSSAASTSTRSASGCRRSGRS
jgi:chemotaxis protein histidine kinase CheA